MWSNYKYLVVWLIKGAHSLKEIVRATELPRCLNVFFHKGSNKHPATVSLNKAILSYKTKGETMWSSAIFKLHLCYMCMAWPVCGGLVLLHTPHLLFHLPPSRPAAAATVCKNKQKQNKLLIEPHKMASFVFQVFLLMSKKSQTPLDKNSPQPTTGHYGNINKYRITNMLHHLC